MDKKSISTSVCCTIKEITDIEEIVKIDSDCELPIIVGCIKGVMSCDYNAACPNCATKLMKLMQMNTMLSRVDMCTIVKVIVQSGRKKAYLTIFNDVV